MSATGCHLLRHVEAALHSDVDIRVDQELFRLFSGSPFYYTTPMPNWRVQGQTELAYEGSRSFFRLHRGVQCGRKKGTH
jgi:hypothetical protein